MTPLVVHITPSFGPGGAQVRAVQIMNYFGPELRHLIVSLSHETGAASRIGKDVPHTILDRFGDRNPWRSTRKLAGLFAKEKPGLVLTYNWGAIDGVVAARWCGIPVIHAEDGFGADEAIKQKQRRVIYRRVMLPLTAASVAPSTGLLRVMRQQWGLSERKAVYIPNGIDTNRFRPAQREAQARLGIVIGTAGHLRAEKNQGMLIRAAARAAALAGYPLDVRIAGDGPERGSLEREIQDCGSHDRVKLLGQVEQMTDFYHELDIFAMSSLTEQMPVAVLEAMASGLPVVSTDVGDVKEMVSTENRPYVVSDEKAMAESIAALAGNEELRRKIGEANRRKVTEQYSENKMLEAYRALYAKWLPALATQQRHS